MKPIKKVLNQEVYCSLGRGKLLRGIIKVNGNVRFEINFAVDRINEEILDKYRLKFRHEK